MPTRSKRATVQKPDASIDSRKSSAPGVERARGRDFAQSSKQSWLLPAFALILATGLAFFRTLHQDFVNWDDAVNVVDNPWIARLSGANLRHLWTHPYEHLYIPASYTLYALVARASQMPHIDPSVTVLNTLFDPRYFHAVNLGLHVSNALIVLAILRRLTRHEGASLAGALVFALHPLQVESVAWVSEMRGLLSATFCLISIYLYVVVASPTPASPSPFQEEGQGEVSTPTPMRSSLYWLALAAAVIAMLSKPTAVCLPVALFAIDRWVIGRPLRSCAISVLPWLLVAIPLAAVTHAVQSVQPIDVTPLWTRPIVAGDALAFYLGKLFWPTGLTIDYGRTPGSVLSTVAGHLTWLAPVLVAALIYASRVRRPWLVAGGLFSLAFLLPVLGLSPFIYQEYSTVADRYMYLPMFGVALTAAGLLRDISLERGGLMGRPGLLVITAVAIGALAGLTINQVRYWDNSISLFGLAVQRLPSSYQMHSDLGVALSESGHTSDAIVQYRTSLALHPNSPAEYNDIGIAMEQIGDIPDAVDALESAVRLAPDNPRARRNLGLALLKQGDASGAIEQLDEAIRLAPSDPTTLSNFGDGLRQVGRFAEAAQAYEHALAIIPDMPSALDGLGSADYALGRFSDAAQFFNQAVQVSPNDPMSHAALANALLRLRQPDAAIAEYRRSIAIDPNRGAVHYALGFAFNTRGDTADAITELTTAARLEPTPFHYDALGVAYVVAGNNAAARSAFQAALQIDPEFPQARRHLAGLSALSR